MEARVRQVWDAEAVTDVMAVVHGSDAWEERRVARNTLVSTGVRNLSRVSGWRETSEPGALLSQALGVEVVEFASWMEMSSDADTAETGMAWETSEGLWALPLRSERSDNSGDTWDGLADFWWGRPVLLCESLLEATTGPYPTRLDLCRSILEDCVTHDCGMWWFEDPSDEDTGGFTVIEHDPRLLVGMQDGAEREGLTLHRCGTRFLSDVDDSAMEDRHSLCIHARALAATLVSEPGYEDFVVHGVPQDECAAMETVLTLVDPERYRAARYLMRGRTPTVHTPHD